MATISRAAADIAAQIQTDTEAHVTVDSVGSGTHALWGHTSDLGSSAAAWEASATLIASGVSAGQTYEWSGRTPDTMYHFAVVTTDGGLSLSERESFATALARPTNPVVQERNANDARVTWDDETSGQGVHLPMHRDPGDPFSDFVAGPTIAAGEAINFRFTDLGAAAQAFGAAAWDGADRVSGLALVTGPGFASSTLTRILMHML